MCVPWFLRTDDAFCFSSVYYKPSSREQSPLCTGQKIHSFHNLAKGLHVCAYIRYPIKAESVEIANKHVGLLLFGTHCKKLRVAHASFVAVTEITKNYRSFHE
jgi:hypothetical protein